MRVCHDGEVSSYHAFYDVQCFRKMLVYSAGEPLFVTFFNDEVVEQC